MPLYSFNPCAWKIIDTCWDYFERNPDVHQFKSKDDLATACATTFGVHNTTEISSLSRIDSSQPFHRDNLQFINIDGTDSNRDETTDRVNTGRSRKVQECHVNEIQE